MKIKGKILGGTALALCAFTLFGVNANALSTSYNEEFNYIEGLAPIKKASGSTNELKKFSIANVNIKSNKEATFTTNSDNTLNYDLPKEAIIQDNDSTLNFRNTKGGYLYDVPDSSVAISIKFKTNSTNNQKIRLYLPAKDVDLGSGSWSPELLNFNSKACFYNAGNGSKKIAGLDKGIEINNWYTLTTIIEEGTKEYGHDKIHTYLNGKHIYSDDIQEKFNWSGKLFDLNYYNPALNKVLGGTLDPTDQSVTFDYIRISQFNKDAMANFKATSTQSSLAISYNNENENMLPTKVKLRFGGILPENAYDSTAKYGVLVLNGIENLEALTVKDIEDKITAQKAIICNPVKVESGYQFAWVINNTEGHYNTALNAVMFMIKDDTLAFSRPKEASVKSVVEAYQKDEKLITYETLFNNILSKAQEENAL